MKTTLQVAALLPLLATSALAQSSSLNCRTNLATTSVKSVPTTTLTSTNSVQSTSTIPVQSTTTIYIAYISTSSVTTTQTDTTTDTTVTDIFSSTSTVFNINTITTPTTTTTTTTNTIVVSSTSTTEMATTQGWRPIGDTLNSYQFPNKKRALAHPHAVVERALTSGTIGLQKALATSSYAAAVTCTQVVPNPKVKTVYTTLPRMTKTVSWAYKTTTSTSTIHTTSTIVPPDVTSTETDYFTSQVTTYTSTWVTDIETTSTTSTSVLPGPTVWDACAPNNIFGPNFRNTGNWYYAANVANNGPGVGSNLNVLADGASTAVDCCNSCQSLGQCETFIFRARNRNCFLLTHSGESCPNQLNHPNYILSKYGQDTGAGYIVGNGNCGFTYSGNSDASVFYVDGGSGFNGQ